MAWVCSLEIWEGLEVYSFFYKQEAGNMEWSVPGKVLHGHAQFHNLSPSLPIVYTFIPYSSAISESSLQNTNLIMLLSYF